MPCVRENRKIRSQAVRLLVVACGELTFDRISCAARKARLMKLDDYLDRIGYHGPVAPNLACLQGVHRRHVLAISYENLDVQLRRPVDLDVERIFEKMVVRRRGGWCYEMNGLLGWALGEIGFDVMRISGAVMRAIHGDMTFGNHLVLAVQLEVPYIADVGLGDALIDPVPMCEGDVAQAERVFNFELRSDGFWRFRNHPGSIPPDFDFAYEPADEKRLAEVCEGLQNDPESMFRQNLMCFRRDETGGTHVLLGRVLASPGQPKVVLEDPDAFCRTLSQVFELEDPEFADLWPQVCARHELIFGEVPVE